MSKIAGRNGALYVGLADANATATPVPMLKQFTFDQSSDKIDVTDFDDATKSYVAGLPDASGTYSGFYDDATDQLYTAASGGFAARTYLYPSRLDPLTYWFGTATFDMSLDVSVDGSADISGSFSASTSFFKMP